MTATVTPQRGNDRDAGAGDSSSGGASLRVRVQQFGTFLSNMVLPNIAAFIAWGLITALVIETGWVKLIGDALGYTGGYGIVEKLGHWGAFAEDPNAGIVGPMIVYLLPLLIGYTGGRMMYDGNVRGGVVGAIATMGAIAGASVPMFMGAMVMGPLGGWSMKKLDALWSHKIRPGFEMLVNNFSAGIWGMILAFGGFIVAAPFVSAFSTLASRVIDVLVSNNLLPLTSVFIEPAKILFLNNAVNQGILTPLGLNESTEGGQSILFLLEANPGPGLGVLLAFAFFGTGIARASAPGAILIHFVGGIHEIYFPYVLAKPKLLLALIPAGATGIAVNLAFDSGLRSPASPGSIIAVWAAAPPSSLIGVTLSVFAAAAVSFVIAALLLKTDKTDGDLAGAAAQMEANKGKSSSVVGNLVGRATQQADGPIHRIVFACDAGMGSSAMGASVLREKVQKAGHADVSVVNKAISELGDDYDLVVVHRDLASRAAQRTPSATQVTVDNFLASPKYDEIVGLLDTTNRQQVATASSAGGVATATGTEVLSREAVVLTGAATSQAEAINEAGRLLVATGAVEESYIASMHERETSVSTHMGNLLAIPHGTNDAKSSIRRSALSFVRYPQGIDWNGHEVQFVVAIAGAGDDHLALLRQLALTFSDSAQVARLQGASSHDEVIAVLESAGRA